MSVEILMPALSPTMEEGKLARWAVKEGDTINEGDVIAEIETDKATMEIEAIDEGIVGKILIGEGTEGVKVNTVIAVILEEGESATDINTTSSPAVNSTPKEQATAATPTPLAPTQQDKDVSSGKKIFASPLARRIAADKGIDLNSLTGSGPNGRIVKADVLESKAADTKKDAPKSSPTSQPQQATSASYEQVKKLYTDGSYQEVALDGMRKTIAQRLTEAKQTVPHFYLRQNIELDNLLEFRKKLNSREGAIKLSVNDFIIKACAIALQQVPDCNAVWAGDRILKFTSSDVAVAVAVEGGLFTPVLRHSDQKTLSTLSAEMKDLAKRAKERKLAPSEFQGGSFAISNLGMFGIENFDAIISPPHAAILAVGAGTKKPVVRGNDLCIATVMSVTLSVDHRVIDGALGAEFLNILKSLLEEPISMLV